MQHWLSVKRCHAKCCFLPSLHRAPVFTTLKLSIYFRYRFFSDPKWSRLNVTSTTDRVQLWSKFAVISPWERVWAFICKNSIYSRMLCAKFGWNWPRSFKERIFKYFQYNFTISLLPPLWEGHCPSFVQTWISYTQGCFMSSLVEIDLVVLN